MHQEKESDFLLLTLACLLNFSAQNLGVERARLDVLSLEGAREPFVQPVIGLDDLRCGHPRDGSGNSLRHLATHATLEVLDELLFALALVGVVEEPAAGCVYDNGISGAP